MLSVSVTRNEKITAKLARFGEKSREEKLQSLRSTVGYAGRRIHLGLRIALTAFSGFSATGRAMAGSLRFVRDLRLPGPAKVSHSVVVPFATYSPWLDDPAYLAIAAAITNNTLVDTYKCHELWRLVEHAVHLGGDVIEVGVWRGGTGCLMAAHAQALGSPATVFLCDTFRGVVKAGEHDSSYVGGEHDDTSIETVRALAARLNLTNIRILEGIFPDDTASELGDRRFALCHIDVDVYESARSILDWVWPRLRAGGIVVYDDYGFSNTDGVTRLVNERANQPGGLTIHNLNGHAVVVKLAQD
jgi:O-methyltransferase